MTAPFKYKVVSLPSTLRDIRLVIHTSISDRKTDMDMFHVRMLSICALVQFCIVL